ncbi:MAG: PEGA domain-containing protein [Deltaproteobacteria bacterium]|nr:PEGA domain-containing protein [Deltaproteobacteria bacterium]
MNACVPVVILLLSAGSGRELPQQVEENGSLYIKTSPPGAQVIFDGDVLPKRTPMTIEGVPEGEHKVQFILGELKVNCRIGVVADVFKDVFLDLKRPAGRLKVVTDPLEVNVFLDNKAVGKTPLILNNVSFGRHMLKMRKQGFKNLEVEVIVDSPDQTRIGVHLDAVERTMKEGLIKGHEAHVADNAGSKKGRVSFMDVLPWIVLSAGGAMAATGVGFEVYAAKAADAAKRERDKYKASMSAPVIVEHYDNAEHNRKIARTNEITGSVLMGVGAAVIAGGVAWLILGTGDGPPVEACIGPGLGVLVLRGSF